jgi:hypothetical protein
MPVSITRICNGLSSKRDARALNLLFASLYADLAAQSNTTTVSGALAIKAGASAVVKTGAIAYYTINGKSYSKAAGDMAALVGTVTNAKFNVYTFYVDSAGTVTTAMGTEGATLAAVVFPATPANKVMLGYVVINPTGTGNFVGGTTALDDATVVPNAVYVNTVGTSPASLNTTA